MTIQSALQILGAIGVISSILFTGLQIRRNTRALRAAAHHNLSQSFTAMWTPLATSAEVMDLTLRSGDDFDSLTRNEKARVRFHMMLFMRTYENAYFHYKIGILKLQDWVAVLGDLEGNLSRPSSPAIWALVRSRTGAEFAAVVDDIIARQDQEAMATS